MWEWTPSHKSWTLTKCPKVSLNSWENVKSYRQMGRNVTDFVHMDEWIMSGVRVHLWISDGWKMSGGDIHLSILKLCRFLKNVDIIRTFKIQNRISFHKLSINSNNKLKTNSQAFKMANLILFKTLSLLLFSCLIFAAKQQFQFPAVSTLKNS